MFVNLLHEGLCFLFANSHDCLPWNTHRVVAQFSDTEPQEFTIIYLYMVCDAFEQYKRACVSDDDVLKMISLNQNIDYNSVWDVSNPEVAAEESVILVQLAVIAK